MSKSKIENEILKDAYFCLQKIGLLCDLLEVESVAIMLIEVRKGA